MEMCYLCNRKQAQCSAMSVGPDVRLKVGFPLPPSIETTIPLINVRTEISKRLHGFFRHKLHDSISPSSRAVNPPRHKILRIDKEEIIDDVISHDK